MTSFVLGIDIGGTFTDVTLVGDNGQAFTAKVLNTPGDLARACVEGTLTALAKAQADGGSIQRIVHATTQATNEIIERKRRPVAFLVTEGFGDLFSISGADRRDLYDLGWTRWDPPVERTLTVEIPERIGYPDLVVRPLDEDVIRETAGRLRAAEVDAVAVCLLHSYVAPDHERRVAEILHEYLPDAFIALSSDVWPEPGEYNRAVATVLSAYIGPVMRGYLTGLQTRLTQHGVRVRLQVMQSNGGAMSVEGTIARPLFSVESGPAAGVIGASTTASRSGYDHVVTFDMGGTTAKVAAIERGQPELRNEFRVGGDASGGDSGVLIQLPVIDLAEVGAGGGSIAWVDSGGVLRVGPRSAGARPGPACYGFGGWEPTVTDANLVLGYLSPSYFLGGNMALSAADAEAAVSRLASELGCSAVEAAANIHDIVNLNMEEAMRIVTISRGKDPREYILMGFGGAGPSHVARLAQAFGINRVVVPPMPGLFSTVGLTSADLVYEEVRSLAGALDDADPESLENAFAEMAIQPRLEVERAGCRPEDVIVERSVDIRRNRQPHALNVPIGSGRLDAAGLVTIKESYASQYAQLYGVRSEAPLLLSACRVRVRGLGVRHDRGVSTESADGPAQKGSRRAFFREFGGFIDTLVYERTALAVSDDVTGPAIIEEVESTTVVPPGWTATIDQNLNLVLQRNVSHH
jgi:N-methylhydantoinase A